MGRSLLRYRSHASVIAIFAVWVLTRAFMLGQVGYYQHGAHIDYQDVNVFHQFSDQIARTRVLPGDTQYPPGAILVFLLPRLVSGHYGAGFVAMILAFDLATTVALVCMGGKTDGAWMWVLGIPALGTIVLIRFDVVPTAFAVIALLFAVRSKPVKFGIAAGIGIAVKLWPVLLLLALGRRGGKAAVAAVVTFGAFLLGSVTLLSGDSLGFIGNQGGRGLELESVAGTPWYLRQALAGSRVSWGPGNGSLEILGGKADFVAGVLHIATMALAVALVIWWITVARATDRVFLEIGRDAVFTAVLLFVVFSAVLSPQYLVWLIGVAAAAVAAPNCLVRRPAAAVMVAVLLTRALLDVWGDLVSAGGEGATLLTFRNVVLVIAAVDATLIMGSATRRLVAGRTEPPAVEAPVEMVT